MKYFPWDQMYQFPLSTLILLKVALIFFRGPKDMNILSNQLRKHLTAVNIALKHYVQEFLFVLCDEDGSSD